MRRSYETQTIHQTNKYWYNLSSRGFVTQTSTKTWKERRLKICTRRNLAVVHIDKHEYGLKYLVAKTFMPEYKKGDLVVNINGDKTDCSITNLKVVSMKEYFDITGRNAKSTKKIQVVSKITGEKNIYPSIRLAAEKLHCDYSTLRRYLNGEIKHSILDDYQAERI